MTKPSKTLQPVPMPTQDERSLFEVTRIIKQNTDTLAGTVGDVRNRAVTVNDLLKIGVITQAQADQL